jgi:hypothetical protein
MDDIKRALASIYAIQNQQQATEESVEQVVEEPTGAQAAQDHLGQGAELKGSFNAKTFGALLGMDSSEASLLASFLTKHKKGMQPSRNELLAAADVFRALVDAEPQVTTQALSMLRRISADTAEGAYESVEDEIAQVVDESIRITKEGVEECWGDMAAPAAPAQAGETMTVNISMPNKNISVTTDSVDEIMNVLKLAGIAVGTTEPAVAEPEAPAADAEPAMVGAPVATVANTPTGIAGDVDGDGDHDKADHDAEEPADDEEKDDKAIMGAKESAKPDFNDVDKDGNEKESWEDAEKDKQNESLSQHDEINYRLNANREPTQQELDLPGVQYDPDSGMIAVKNATSLANTHRALQKAGWEQYTRNKGQAGAVHAGDSAYQLENQRILQLAGLDETKLANSPASTSMDEPTEFDSLPSEKGTGAGKPDYGTRQSNMGGENPMALHSLDMEESFQQAMGEYRKFVAENISKKK